MKNKDNKSCGIFIRCSPQDKEIIKAMAKTSNLTSSEYLRQLAIGYEPKSQIDNEAILKLCKINGDLGRLGGLLKWWLTDDKKTQHYNTVDLRVLVNNIESTRLKLDEKIAKYL